MRFPPCQPAKAKQKPGGITRRACAFSCNYGLQASSIISKNSPARIGLLRLPIAFAAFSRLSFTLCGSIVGLSRFGFAINQKFASRHTAPARFSAPVFRRIFST